MIAYQREKIENAICFFASEHKRKTRKPLHQTFLYKYLAFLDFEGIKETGRPVLGLNYKAMKWGPVPEEIYSKKDYYNTPLFIFQRDLKENRIMVLPKRKPDLRFFSKYEISLMEKLIEIFADRYVYTGLISDASHEEIIAWKRTWEKRPNEIIDYALTFDTELMVKPFNKLSRPEENFLIYKTLENQ